MPPKKPKSPTPVLATKHKDKRANIPTEESRNAIVALDERPGSADLLNLILECTGQKKEDKEEKVATMKELCVPALNDHGALDRWAFFEIRDPWDAQNEIHAEVTSRCTKAL